MLTTSYASPGPTPPNRSRSLLGGITRTRAGSKPVLRAACARVRLPIVAAVGVPRLTQQRPLEQRHRPGQPAQHAVLRAVAAAEPLEASPPITWYIECTPRRRATSCALKPCGTKLKPMTQSKRSARVSAAHVDSLAPARVSSRCRRADGVTPCTPGRSGTGQSETIVIDSTSGSSSSGRMCERRWFAPKVTVIRMRRLRPSALAAATTSRVARRRSGRCGATA